MTRISSGERFSFSKQIFFQNILLIFFLSPLVFKITITNKSRLITYCFSLKRTSKFLPKELHIGPFLSALILPFCQASQELHGDGAVRGGGEGLREGPQGRPRQYGVQVHRLHQKCLQPGLFIRVGHALPRPVSLYVLSAPFLPPPVL